MKRKNNTKWYRKIRAVLSMFTTKYVLSIGFLSLILAVPSFVFAAKLNSTDGCVVTDFLTRKPVSGVKVVATTSSDLKSEQRYVKFETTTDKNGKYGVKGLADHSYQISLIKNGYRVGNSGVSISSKGATICRNQDKLLPELPYSDLEFNFYDPVKKVLTKKIDEMTVFDSLNKGYGDVHYYYDKSKIDQLEPVQSPTYVLRVYNKKNGTNTSNGTTDFISRLIPLDDKYEVALNDKTSVYFAQMRRIYSYDDGNLYKELYQLPYLPNGFYSLGYSYNYGGSKSLFRVK